MNYLSSYGGVTTMTTSLRKAENGIIVMVDYPKAFLDAKRPQMSDAIFSALGKIQKSTEDNPEGALDPMAVFSQMTNAIADVQKADKAEPLHKEHEEYVFSDIEKALAFIRELFEVK